MLKIISYTVTKEEDKIRIKLDSEPQKYVIVAEKPGEGERIVFPGQVKTQSTYYEETSSSPVQKIEDNIIEICNSSLSVKRVLAK